MNETGTKRYLSPNVEILSLEEEIVKTSFAEPSKEEIDNTKDDIFGARF